ncbi:hypothetical protein MVEG_11581 [Podila verticillata NRRL 6337]|uniref:Large ribosomal subunit protein mL50 n=1 Tax=Podila verticillata NRRL 6337 TaxID=1069443 RepID=A0A086TK95_9FUNG|nr:hypothetical protein MVEG_11581 [Podila verticillata NRRL 6337]
MHSTRSAVAAIARASSRASIMAPRSVSHLHTTRFVLAEEKRGLFSRLNPFAKPASQEPATTEAAKPAEDLNVEIAEEEAPIPSWKSDLQPLTKEQLEESVRSAASSFVTTTDLHLGKVQLNDPSVKFQVLKACVQSTGREIPSKDIASIRTLKDIVVVMERLDLESQSRSANPKGHVVAEWFDKNKSSLPPNMVFIPYQKSRGVKAEDRKTTNKRFL